MKNNGINVLSLFDGISCGQIALERTGIKVNNYYASEIDKHAIKVTQHNYPNTIQLGDVTKWKEWNIEWSKVNLLTAGFPCQAWSLAGKQGGISDPIGALAITLFEIFEHIKKENLNFCFLFENVKMKKQYLTYLNTLFNIDQIEINSSFVSAQHRKRLYWSNIVVEKRIEDKNLTLKDILDNNVEEKYNSRFYKKKEGTLSYKKSRKNIRTIHEKSKTLLTGGHGISNSGSTNIFFNDDFIRIPTPRECERLQTLPENYTNIGITDAQRYHCIGNGWTVDVIAHIFSHLPYAK